MRAGISLILTILLAVGMGVIAETLFAGSGIWVSFITGFVAPSILRRLSDGP